MFVCSWPSLLSAGTHRKAQGSLRGLGKPLSLAFSQSPFHASNLLVGRKGNSAQFGLFESPFSPPDPLPLAPSWLLHNARSSQNGFSCIL